MRTTSVNKRFTAAIAVAISTGLILSACSGADKTNETKETTASSTTKAEATESKDASTTATEASGDSTGPVTVENCGKPVTYDKHNRLFVNDGNIISIVLAAGGAKNIVGVSSLGMDKPTLMAAYGEDTINNLNDVAEKYPTVEQLIDQRTDIYVAGWNYGLSEAKNLTPDILAQHDIDTYILTESCRQEGSTARGLVDPWTSVNEDLKNWGKILGTEEKTEKVIASIDKRRKALADAPKPEKTPTVFVFDSGTDTVFTSGKFAAPDAIIAAADAKNATHDIDDSWVRVGWEEIAASQPDAFVMVDYPGQTFEEKVEQLKTNPVTKDLEAVKQDRFINLPYALWTASPLNIDAAEQVRKGLEKFKLVPESDITTQLKLPADLPGQSYFK